MLLGIVQCVQCRNWSHNNCIGRAAIHDEGELPDWTCRMCVTNDAERKPSALDGRMQQEESGKPIEQQGIGMASNDMQQRVCHSK